MISFTDCLIVMGRRGCGKSFLAKRLQSLWPKRVIIDSLSEYTSEEGAIVVHDFSDFAGTMMRLKSENSANFVLVFQFDPESTMSEAEFDHIMRLCFYFGGIQVVIEEVQLYSNVHHIPHWLRQCLLIGRHQNLSLLFTSQRPGEVHKTIVSQCSHVFTGTIVEGNDIRYLSNFYREHADKLSSLPERKFLYLSKAGVSEIDNNFS